jgi:pantoate--beta-alanine ligase
MHIFYGKAPLIAHLNSSQFIDSTIGFVPTMGALHDGHLALMERSIRENGYTVVSIFVNPTQFNNPDDLAKYPRTLEEDVRKITALNPEMIVYAPSVDDIYDGKPISQSFDFDGLENQMEGKFRPGHFDGVGTIVKRLFEIVTPTNAYFGEKDFQQLQIVKKLVAKNQLPVTIIGCPIYREANQLAMSSRNERLSANDRNQASAIQLVEQTFENHPLFDLEYFVIADEETLLSSITKEENKNYRAFIAVFVNNIRLIDTISLN